MPNCVQKKLVKYRHNAPKRPQYCPYEPAPVQYGRKLQELPVEEESKLLDKEGKLCVQQVIGSFLYYARAVNMTILHALNPIAAESSKPTERTTYGTGETASQLYAYLPQCCCTLLSFRHDLKRTL